MINGDDKITGCQEINRVKVEFAEISLKQRVSNDITLRESKTSANTDKGNFFKFDP